MTTTKKTKIEKFHKKDRICNICQQEKELSIDHVPPQTCPPVKSRVTSKLLYQIIGDTSFRPRYSQNGVTFKTICNDCNNLLGSRYDWALGEFSRKIENFVESNLSLPDSFEVECQPNAVMRSVLGHLLAAKTETDEVVVDGLIRPCVIDSSQPIHDDIHIFYWVYPYEETVILRDFCMPAVRGKFQDFGFFNLIKFYPLAFLVTHQLASYEGLSSLHQFNQLLPGDKRNLQINLRPMKHSKFPEDFSKYNFLAVGRTAKEDSVYSVPRLKKGLV
ncbi:hypothetical protein ACE1CI_09030 [Aerosakkonemataceae cyanobacterium BLCC-F50]|uniref:HNH endonuclease 5 domain-containing protein n=1 Tax=Floridaenema flaviceps BLCC-F50 TaxID=3153642 RepID=A0ABV4XPM9_9CYAN